MPKQNLLPSLVLLLATACSGATKPIAGQADTAGGAFDEDGDGYPAGQDCNDEDSAVFPGALERCDGVDNNCDGAADEGVQVTVYPDDDGDGFGDGARGEEACGPTDGTVANGNDCDDAAPDMWPGNPESCDGADNDCNGEVDDGVGDTVWADADMDGFGDAAAPSQACAPGPGTADNPDDCDDADPFISPGGAELCNDQDDDCDGAADEGLLTRFYWDVDGDTYGNDATATDACERPDGTATRGGDCDDTDFAFFPGAPETDCTDPADYNCDGTVGYADADADGFPACVECDDTRSEVSPAGAEVCNGGVDDDCDGLADDADDSVDLSGASWFYADADGDGFGDADAPLLACDAPVGFVADATDCDDATGARFPGAPEVCNAGTDDDCDGLADDADPGRVAASTAAWYRDADGDGDGTSTAFVFACAPPAGYVARATDCDDTRAAVFGGAAEVCDGLDNDCDLRTDDADTSLDLASATTWYRDNDGDGDGDPSSTARACLPPTGFRSGAGDCDDTRATVSTSATEVCDGLDNDCDALTDDADPSRSGGTAFYADADADGHGDAARPRTACALPAGHAAAGDDCDDGAAAVSPSATEICDTIDNDCDALTDDNDPGLDLSTASPFYADADGDAFGDAARPVAACRARAGLSADATDCDDTTAARSPAMPEVCADTTDNDCDGAIDRNDTDCTLAVALSADATDVSLAARVGFPTAPVSLVVTVGFGVTLSATDPSVPALSTAGLPAGSTVQLINRGVIHGAGGDGACAYGGDGQDGGPAIEATVALVIDNTAGAIYGGGGGGGSGDDPRGGGGGAGGGLGCDGGSDATGGYGGDGYNRYGRVAGGDPTAYDGSPGTGGAAGCGGANGGGGSGGAGGPAAGCGGGGQGGAGGGWGGGGGGGAGSFGYRNIGAGGDAGAAVLLSGGSVSWTGGLGVAQVKGDVR